MSTLVESHGRLKVGDKAPDFEGPTFGGKRIGLKDFVGKKHIVLYFYPRDHTSGCTKEACGFRDLYGEIKQLGAEVIGVSLDSVESHESFARKHSLPFPLISDGDKKIAKAYGAMGVAVARRMTFLIDKQGRIRRIFSKVDVNEHAKEIVAELKSLSKGQSSAHTEGV